MADRDFEQKLVEALQPIRHFALAQALFVAMDCGVYKTLLTTSPLETADIAALHGLDVHRLSALCMYLANEGYLVNDGGWRLTDKFRGLAPFQPWYTLLVGGYAQTFLQLEPALKADTTWATRNGVKVGVGSCGISMYDALPLTQRLLGKLGCDDFVIIDLGCGDGAFLAELARGWPEVKGIGLEPDLATVTLANDTMKREGLRERVSVHQGRAVDALTLDLPSDRVLCFLTAFVLQEMLEQEGTDAVETLLRTTFERHPDANWVVIEVDYRPTDRRLMSHELSLAYYNPYYLIHALTEQRLETAQFWQSLFSRAGLEIVELQHPDENVDSTGLEMGYLLRRS